MPSRCYPRCGDGKVISPETCDDGNNADSKGCRNNCMGALPGWTCTAGSSTTASVCTSVCGNGIIANLEVCDDANTVNGDGCSSTCLIETGYTCLDGGANSC